jgi:hypothetical protein
MNQTCSPRRDLSNDVSHFQFGGREEVDSRLLVVRSQIANLTPGPSFAHNLGYRCPNDQCEAIFYIYASRPFQWHQEHLNARCFRPCCRTLNIRESRRTPNPQLWKCWASPPHLAKVGLRQHAITCHLQLRLIVFYNYFAPLTILATMLQLHLQLMTFSSYTLNYFSFMMMPICPIISNATKLSHITKASR